MNNIKRRAAIGLGAVTLLAGACSGGHKAAAPPTTTTSTTVAPTTTTTLPPTFPLTGMPAPNARAAAGPAVVIKIDNVDAARPQTGVQNADVVYEAEVEGGLTRLAAIYQSNYPSKVGPVRSGRLTDEGVADDLNHPVLVFAGTNNIFLPILAAQPVTLIDDDNHPNSFVRIGDNAPHNLFSNVGTLASYSATHTAPAPLFDYLAAGQPFSGVGVASATGVSLGFQAASISWKWDTTSNRWLRDQNGTADVAANGQRLAAKNVVIYFVNYISSGTASGEGVPDAEIPEGILTGSGAAWVFSGGKVVKGTWKRASLTSVATYTDSAGQTIDLAPGNTWVELAVTGSVPTITP